MHSLVARSMVVLGVLSLLAAAGLPWMKVPSGFATGPDGRLACTTDRPRSAIPFRAACAALAVATSLAHARRRAGGREAMLAGSALAVFLSFPAVVMGREPSLSARANWLHAQHENLTGMGGDLFTNLESGRKSWKDRIYLVDSPGQISLVPMPGSGLAALQAGRLSAWFEALGYSNGFCQFAGPGWFAALLGSSLLVMGECLPGGRLSRRRVGLAVLVGAATALVGLVAAAGPVVVASRSLERSRTATALGRFDEAEAHLRGAIAALPALGEGTFSLAQLGLLDHRRGRVSTPEGRLFLAFLLEREGKSAQASALYSALLAEVPEGSAARREANRAILRDATYALNAGRVDDAIRRLELVLGEEPCNLKANYALQLAYLRAGRRADVDRLVRRIGATYAHFRALNKVIVLAQCRENSMFAALKEGDMDATFRHALGAKKP